MISEDSFGQSTSHSEVGTPTRETPITKVHESPTRLLSAESHRECDVHIHDGLSPEQIDQRVSEKLEAPEVQRALINEFSPYSEHINDHIRSYEDLKVYLSQDLREKIVNGRHCLTAEVNWEQTDAMETTNTDRTAVGSAAVDENGDSFHLHHIGQKESSPLAELKADIHREFDSVLHDKTVSSKVHGEGSNWNAVRIGHWKARSPAHQN
jgi:hypothetical protein